MNLYRTAGILVAGMFVLGTVACGAAEGTSVKGPESVEAEPGITEDEALSLSDNEENPPADDVKVTGCEHDTYDDSIEVVIKVTNNSSKTSDYDVTVEVVDQAGDRMDEAWLYVEKLRPGQSTKTLSWAYPVDVPSKFECRLLSADRWSSEG